MYAILVTLPCVGLFGRRQSSDDLQMRLEPAAQPKGILPGDGHSIHRQQS